MVGHWLSNLPSELGYGVASGVVILAMFSPSSADQKEKPHDWSLTARSIVAFTAAESIGDGVHLAGDGGLGRLLAGRHQRSTEFGELAQLRGCGEHR